MTGIYKITNKINNNCYIGQSVDIERRWKQHIKNSSKTSRNSQYPLYRAFRKYGLNNFTFEILCLCDKSELTRQEEYWFLYYKPKYNQLYPAENPTSNPEIEAKRQAIFQTEEYKAKCSKPMSNSTKQKISYSLKHSNAFKQAHNSPEYKQKMYDIRQKGKRANKPVILYNDTEQYTFDSMNECSNWLIKHFNCSSTPKVSHITEVCEGKRKTIFGYKCSYK